MADTEQVLIVTRSDDNSSIQTVSDALLERGVQPVRLNTDLYPSSVRVSSFMGGPHTSAPRRTLSVDVEGGEAVTVDLERLAAVWYRRFHAGANLPASLGDTRPACVAESRRALFGFIAGLPCFHLDPLESVRRCDHKELQMLRARELGLDVPRTLISNDPVEVRRFFDECDGQVITKMQHSFAIYRDGDETVVFTNLLQSEDLNDLSGLACSPMVFQEHVEKRLELRTTVVGTRVMTAAIDSQKTDETALDWRRDGVGLIDAWQPYDLPASIAEPLVRLLAELGLNYGAADFIVTPEGRTVFLEVNAVGEFFWLDQNPGLPISSTIADVLTGRAPRNPIALEAWRNDT